jgi:uncharacterized protein YaiI (UPF0178 family)
MQILVDADACPVVHQVEAVAQKYGIAVTLLCDTNHVMASAYSKVRTIEAGADSVDIALINICHAGDIVVTQDYGVAAMALGRHAYAVHQNGWQYTDENMDRLLMERHIAKKARRASKKNYLHGPKKRTAQDNDNFVRHFEALVRSLHEKNDTVVS